MNRRETHEGEWGLRPYQGMNEDTETLRMRLAGWQGLQVRASESVWLGSGTVEQAGRRGLWARNNGDTHVAENLNGRRCPSQTAPVGDPDL